MNISKERMLEIERFLTGQKKGIDTGYIGMILMRRGEPETLLVFVSSVVRQEDVEICKYVCGVLGKEYPDVTKIRLHGWIEISSLPCSNPQPTLGVE